MRNREVISIGLAVLALGVMTSRGVTTLDEAIHLDTALGWITRLEDRLSLDPGPLWVPTRRTAGGLFFDDGEGLRSASTPGLALLTVPLVAPVAWLEAPTFAELARPLSHESSPRAALRPLARDLRVLAFSLIGPISAALAVFFLLLAGRALELSRRAQLVGAAALALGSPLLAFAGTAWTQLPTTALMAFALWQCAARAKTSRISATGLGLALAAMILIRPDHLPFAVLLGVATYQTDRGWRRSPSRSMLRLLGPVAVVMIALAFHGLPASGDDWQIARVPVGFAGLLLSPRTGLIVFAPFVCLAPWGLETNRRPLLWPLLGIPIVALVFYGGWFDWPGSLVYGPRFLLPTLPALALLFARASERFERTSFVLLALGFLVELPGALLVHARIAESDDFFDPAPLRAWQTLFTEGAVGDLGVDCASTHALGFMLATLLIACIGLAWEVARHRRAFGP